jgi:hypothetical protein
MSALALLAAAAAAAPDLAICADRPAKANAACTVPDGHWQVEISAIDWARARDGDVRTDVTSVGQTLVKLGVTERSDVEIGWTPMAWITSRDGGRDHWSGAGDTIVRWKQRLTASGAGIQAALLPFAKLPTADHGIGNGKVEGGVAVPLAAAAGPVTVTLGPEVDLLADADGHGYHAGVANALNLSASPAPRLSVSAELWGNLDFDPSRTVRQASADVAAAYLAGSRVQFDAGANFGLNRATPDAEVYLGLSTLF